jgi:hypothetical protein
MNLISILTHFDPDYNYYSLGAQSWSQIELIFGVEKEYIDIFLSKSIDFDIPYKYVVIERGDYNKLIDISNSYYVLFMNDNEVWGVNYLKTIKQFFMERQDLGKSLKTPDQINIDPLAVNRNVFYFLGKVRMGNNKTNPIMMVFNELHFPFNLAKAIPKPTFFQPGVKFLLPLEFIKDHNIKYIQETDNVNFNVALFYLDTLSYLYKSNNFFEPQYYNLYLDYTVSLDTNTLQKYNATYKEKLNLKKQIFEGNKNSHTYWKYKLMGWGLVR